MFPSNSRWVQFDQLLTNSIHFPVAVSSLPIRLRVYVFDNARLFENLPGKRFNKIIIIYLIVNEIIREMVYFRNDTNIPYEK